MPLEQMAPLAIQLEDLYRSLRAHAAGLEADPLRLEGINTRLAELEKIKRRYGPEVETALARLAEGEEEWSALENVEENLGALESRLAEVAAQLHAFSVKLSRKRGEAAARFDQAIAIQLGELGMERAGFETRIAPLAAPAGKTPSYAATGMDTVEFLLSTNPGQALRPLSRIASGGELSRTMLALKTILAKADPTITLIFDEVDAGISGRMAEIVGRKLRTLGETHQVLCVTHLPQIAALGHQNVRVSKHAADGETFTRVEPLDEKAKVEEVARLLSGLRITSHSLASAEEMVNRGRTTGA
jgi:DNA repair protein RecN (Recombination protein N)